MFDRYHGAGMTQTHVDIGVKLLCKSLHHAWSGEGDPATTAMVRLSAASSSVLGGVAIVGFPAASAPGVVTALSGVV